MRIDDYTLSHLILRFEQEKDMKVMHCVQNLGALRDLVDARVEIQVLLLVCEAVLKLPRPWMDGGITSQGWNRAFAEIEAALAKHDLKWKPSVGQPIK